MKQKLAIAALLIALLLVVWRDVLPSMGQARHGFVAYYTASWLLLRGEFGPQVYDDDWFAAQLQQIEPTVYDILRPTLPTAALLAIPFTPLEHHPARTLWLWLIVVIVLASVALLARILDGADWLAPRWWLFGAFALLFPAVGANIAIGQMIPLFLLLLTVALYGLERDRLWLTGLALGATFALKSVGPLAWLIFLHRARWQGLLWAGGTLTSIILLSLPAIGVATWLAYVEGVFSTVDSGLAAVTAYQTTNGLLTHLFVFDPRWNPSPVVDWPVLAQSLTLLISLTAVGVTLWRGWHQHPTRLTFAALITLSVILLPVAEDHHYILLLIPIAVVGQHLLERPSPLAASLLILAVVLLIAPIPYEGDWAGWSSLLAYPRLYGGWLLWAAITFDPLPNPPSEREK